MIAAVQGVSRVARLVMVVSKKMAAMVVMRAIADLAVAAEAALRDRTVWVLLVE
jgi:hypothetical protein